MNLIFRISLRGASTRHEYSPTVMVICLEYEVADQSRESSEIE